jgi:hypothetical protein
MSARVISILLLWVALLMPTIVYSADGRFCQKGVYVYFGNGVWNDFEQADESRWLLEKRLEARILGTELEGVITYGVSHNPSMGMLADLLETFVQNTQTDESQFWRYLAALDPIPEEFKDLLVETANKVNASILNANPAVQEHVLKYNKNLSEGNKVVVVAHSQGNLFANIAGLGITPQYANGFGVVSVANPDNFVAGGGPYTTIDEDLIIWGVSGSMPANLDNFSSINWNDLTGHTFATSYMASGHAAEAKILNDIVNIANGLSYPDTDLGTGAITATLTWNSMPDLDLHVFEPSGAHVYYRNLTGTSGYLDLDDVNGYGPEHYFVSCDKVETGTYRFGVNYYSGPYLEIGTLTLQAGEQTRSRQQAFSQALGSSGNSTPTILFELQVTGSKEKGFEYVVQ